MFKRQLLIDSFLSVGLMAALVVVFVIDRQSPTPERELADGDAPAEVKLSLLGTNQPQRRKPSPRPDSIYAERVAENRIEVAKKRGGSPISEQAVNDGLDWLARHQAKDGSWSNQCLGTAGGSRCEKDRQPCDGPGGPYSFAQTGLALLAFQGGGHFWFNETPYSLQVKRGLDWLIANQNKNGQFGNRGASMYEHAIATFALAEACALAKHSDEKPDRKYQDALEQAVKYIGECQDPNGGGWRYSPRQVGDSSVSGWVVLALKSAQAAEVKVSPAVMAKCIDFFRKLEMASDGRTGYTDCGSQGTEATTGVGMLVHHFLLDQSDSPLVKAASGYLAAYAATRWRGNGADAPDYYLWYNCTLGMYLAGGQNWEKWNGIVREAVLHQQAKQGCERGSWPPNDQWGGHGGRIYSTALAILTLEVYYRFAKKEKASNQSKKGKTDM